MTSEFSIAVHALVYLNHKAQCLSSEVLSENICTNSARVRKIMAKLKKSALIETKEGVDGGYFFHRNPSEINLKMVSEAVDFQFVAAAWRSGDEDMECLVASGMANIMDGIYHNLDQLCKERLAQITILDIDSVIFGGKNEHEKNS